MAVQTLPAEAGLGHTASRTLLKASGGAVVAFSFGAGGGLDEHATPREALAVVTEGALDVTLEGETQTVRAGEAVQLPARAPHAVRAPGGARMLLVLLRP